MPGILPMKVIKVGTSAQTRIAQACDRCRSKKIRCDGFRPCCSQCSNVGFDCKTSDKLSRRAFPRGYTESLEERVRALENEVRELKDLLDEKEEKIDMLSKVQSRSPRPSMSHRDSSPPSQSSIKEIKEALQREKDDTFKVQQTPFLLDGENSDSYFSGCSSGKALVDAFKRKVQESGQSGSAINAEAFFAPTSKRTTKPKSQTDGSSFWKAPPRLVSDQMVNIFFQEWGPLFPILHRPSFLTLYDQYVSGSSPVQDKKSLAQLNLVFGIASLSNEARVAYDVECCEQQWVTALDSFIKDTSMINLQCLLLAQLYCIQKGDHAKALHYKSLAVGIAQRLGLHLSQKRFAFGALTSETRKRVFWTLYTIDCFTAASFGLPRQLREVDVHCEYPVDADDEYVTEKGFQPTLPGESTKISSALALFRAARILAMVLEQNYPMSATHELSMRNIGALSDELDSWQNELAPHLRMQFVQDKPSTNVISSRSPLLSLTYYYIRALIHRPAVCAHAHEKSSSSLMSMAAASRSIVQIVQLLDERKLSFSFCLSKNETLVLAGFGLFFQALDLDEESKLMRETQKKIQYVMGVLERSKSSDALEFKRTSRSLFSISPTPSEQMSPPQRSASALPAMEISTNKPKDQLEAILARYTQAVGKNSSSTNDNERRSTAPAATQRHAHGSPRFNSSNRSSVTPKTADSSASPAKSVSTPNSSYFKGSSKNTPAASLAASSTNLDYFSFPSDPVPSPRNSKPTQAPESTSWDQILNTLGGNNVSTESIFDWAPTDELSGSPSQYNTPQTEVKQAHTEWSPDIWGFQPTANSVFSMSDESLTSGEDFSSVDVPSLDNETIRAIMIPDFGTGEADVLELTDFQATA